jgi:hypothetical protein
MQQNPVSDQQSIGRDAVDAPDRRLALECCLNNFWGNFDVQKIERVENANFKGWVAFY